MIKHVIFIESLAANIKLQLRNQDFDTTFVSYLKTAIFGKLLKENTHKRMQSPKVRNTECKTYFAFAYFSMLHIEEISEKVST